MYNIYIIKQQREREREREIFNAQSSLGVCACVSVCFAVCVRWGRGLRFSRERERGGGGVGDRTQRNLHSYDSGPNNLLSCGAVSLMKRVYYWNRNHNLSYTQGKGHTYTRGRD